MLGLFIHISFVFIFTTMEFWEMEGWLNINETNGIWLVIHALTLMEV